MNDEPFPKIVYKFRDQREQYHLDTLASRTAFFAARSTFNDPFEQALKYRYDLMSEQEQLEHFMEPERWSDLVRDMPAIERLQNLRANIHAGGLDPADHSRSNIELLESKCGLLSTASTWNSVLMWSHYSSSHEGFCVGWNYDILRDFFKNQISPEVVVIPCHAVYSEDSNIDPRGRSSDQLLRQLLTTKSSVWKYEDEVRFLMMPRDPVTSLEDRYRKVTLPENAIAEVMLGWRMPQNVRDMIRQLLEKFAQRPVLYEIEGSFEGFDLIRKKVDID